ncbi:MAG: methionine adenosyltransferase [Bacteroidales bacterium]|nr:methionine adenosyltransferase [Bacteroidales bacterium]MBR4137498.1 methionine adenosyltransferase [Bacteroidales bacterium]
MGYYFTSESVSEGHPDKVADQISDAVLDEMLRQDPESKVACETLVTTGLTVVAGEVKSDGYVDIQGTARRVIERIGYTKAEYQFDSKSCGVLSAIHGQSQDINRGVERKNEEDQGAGDQGMMFGYACKETPEYMPLTIVLSHMLLLELAKIRREGKRMKYLRPDAKSQVTVEYGANWKPLRIDTIVISTQHDEFMDDDAAMIDKIEHDVRTILLPRLKKLLPQKVRNLFKSDMKLFVNPTGKFVIGGPHGDTGLTGRKIIVDTYGGRGAHGGGAFSGKDSSKVDRSAAYAARHIAKNIVAAGVCDEALVQIAYAIGVAQPVGFYVNTYGTAHVKDANGRKMGDAEIAEKLKTLFDLRPYAIVKRFGLKNPIFEPTASYGHFGRDPFTAKVEVLYKDKDTFTENGKNYKNVEFFAWEKLDMVPEIQKVFSL